jgi:small subunit ribosomal protein S1
VVDLGDDVEGFVPTSQLAGRDLSDPTGIFKEGEQIPLQVIEFDQHQHKVVLSVVAYYKKRERDEFESYLAQHKPAATTMGDAMPETMKAAAAAPETAPIPPTEPEGDGTLAEEA